MCGDGLGILEELVDCHHQPHKLVVVDLCVSGGAWMGGAAPCRAAGRAGAGQTAGMCRACSLAEHRMERPAHVSTAVHGTSAPPRPGTSPRARPQVQRPPRCAVVRCGVEKEKKLTRAAAQRAHGSTFRVLLHGPRPQCLAAPCWQEVSRNYEKSSGGHTCCRSGWRARAGPAVAARSFWEKFSRRPKMCCKRPFFAQGLDSPRARAAVPKDRNCDLNEWNCARSKGWFVLWCRRRRTRLVPIRRTPRRAQPRRRSRAVHRDIS